MTLELARSREALKEFDGPELMAQQIVQHGAIHALEMLLRVGVTAENARAMLDSCRENLRVIEAAAMDKGVLLPVTRTF